MTRSEHPGGSSSSALETAAKPMFQLLGTPAEHKKHYISGGGHFVPRAEMIRETLDWLDKYLGKVR